MVLEQGALSGKYDTEHPFPDDCDKGKTYNPILDKLETLNLGLKEFADKHNVAIAQIPVTWTIVKGTLPIVEVTKTSHVEDAIKAINIKLSDSEIEKIEDLAKTANLNVIRYWEKEMK